MQKLGGATIVRRISSKASTIELWIAEAAMLSLSTHSRSPRFRMNSRTSRCILKVHPRSSSTRSSKEDPSTSSSSTTSCYSRISVEKVESNFNIIVFGTGASSRNAKATSTSRALSLNFLKLISQVVQIVRWNSGNCKSSTSRKSLAKL